jgi:hypothetical protein
MMRWEQMYVSISNIEICKQFYKTRTRQTYFLLIVSYRNSDNIFELICHGF